VVVNWLQVNRLQVFAWARQWAGVVDRTNI
jgi:hypothetical protein